MKRYSIIYIVLILILIMFLVPTLIFRIQYEQRTKTYTVAINANRLSKLYKASNIEHIISEYKDAGTTTVIIEEENGMYSKHFLNIAKKLGMNIVLVPELADKKDADIRKIVDKYNVKYIKLGKRVDFNELSNSSNNSSKIEKIYNNIEKNIYNLIEKRDEDSKNKINNTKFMAARIFGKLSSIIKNKIVYNVIKENNLTVILTETVMQLSNEHPFNYKNYIYASEGNLIRAFETYKETAMKTSDYDEVYYEMYNAAYDRNTRFITVNQIEDDVFSKEENLLRTQSSIRLFSEKMEELGFVSEEHVNYNQYVTDRKLLSAITSVLMVFMIYVMVNLVINKKNSTLIKMLMSGSIIAVLVTLFIPEKFLIYYPTAFASIAPCFCITCVFSFIEKSNKKYEFTKLCIYSILLTLILFMLCGTIMIILLSGADYFLNEDVFYGVKLTLILPVIFTFLFLLIKLIREYRINSINDCKIILKKAIHNIRWYHILLAGIILAAGIIYVIRSGNVSSISFFEIRFRNFLKEVFVARPRTKEILLGWPCLVLYIFYSKYNFSESIKCVLALGASILFASVINTFCHVFTMAETMYLRTINGFLLGSIVAVVALIINYIFIIVIKHMQKKVISKS